MHPRRPLALVFAALAAAALTVLLAPSAGAYTKPLYIADDKLETSAGQVFFNPAGVNGPVPYSTGGWGAPENILAVGSSLYVLDAGLRGAADGRLVEIDTLTGWTRTVTQGGAMLDPRGIVQDGPDHLIISDRTAEAIVRVNRHTGQRETIASGGLLDRPVGIAWHPNGELWIVDYSRPGIIALDVSTGTQRVVSVSGLVKPYGLAVLADGRVFIIDSGKGTNNYGALVELVNGATVKRTDIVAPEQITSDDRTLLVAKGAHVSGSTPAVVSYHADTGVRVQEAAGTGVQDAEGVTVGPAPLVSPASPAPQGLNRPVFCSTGETCGPME